MQRRKLRSYVRKRFVQLTVLWGALTASLGVAVTIYMLCWALNESVAVSWLILVMQTHELIWYVVFAPPALALSLLMRPNVIGLMETSKPVPS
jgi:hypothetical protein